MQIEQAIEIIQEYQEQLGFPGILEALQEMQNYPEELNNSQLVAYRLFMMLGGQMFAAA